MPMKNSPSPLQWVVILGAVCFATALFSIFYQKYQKSNALGNLSVSEGNQTFYLQINQSIGGEVFGQGIYPAGKTVRIWADSYPGYAFAGWNGDGVTKLTESNTTVEMISDFNITGHFKQAGIQLKTSTGGLDDFSIRDFEGFEASMYEESTGLTTVKLKYKRAEIEKPKVGFLRMGLAFLMVRDLQVDLFIDRFSEKSLSREFVKLRSQKGVSYAVAEPITVNIRSKSRTVCVSAGRGKLTSSGVLRLWDGVELSEGNRKDHFSKGEILTSDDKKSLHLLAFSDGKHKQIQLD